ncbi:hypothetical protein BX600DRAFT_308517 [Xylariales sp. PMI_506]|nr:hypothetical protein BX600DRAFT_308517 [Xylariales sp. PMI_506]
MSGRSGLHLYSRTSPRRTIHTQSHRVISHSPRRQVCLLLFEIIPKCCDFDFYLLTSLSCSPRSFVAGNTTPADPGSATDGLTNKYGYSTWRASSGMISPAVMMFSVEADEDDIFRGILGCRPSTSFVAFGPFVFTAPSYDDVKVAAVECLPGLDDTSFRDMNPILFIARCLVSVKEEIRQQSSAELQLPTGDSQTDIAFRSVGCM